jgi:L-iditol 2-dehydrogenase
VHWYLDGRIGETPLKEPLTLGHEPAGRVIALGANVDPKLQGQRVAIEPAIHCGHCPWCERGDTNICPTVQFMGTPPTQGAFRQFVTHPAHLVAPLPDGVSDDIGALLEPLAIGVHAVDLLKPRLASDFVIQGAGPIGLCCLLAVRLFAPRRVIMIEPLPERRALAKSLGANEVFAPDDPDVVKAVQRLGGGYGVPYVIEAVGARESFGQMVHFAEPGGKIAVIGIHAHDDFGFDNSPARRKGLTLYMVRRSRHTLERAIELTQGGWWHPEALITHRRPLNQLAAAMEMLAGYQDGVLKTIIDPR